MPRYPNFDPSIDECLTIRVGVLSRWGHLQPGLDVFNRQFIWRRNGRPIARVGYLINCREDEHSKVMTLDYLADNAPIKYQVKLEAIPSNLGTGLRWYFICPETGKRCMNLICPPGSKYFLHRTAFPNLIYESQKKSKEYRRIEATYGWMFEEEKLCEQLYQKYRKTHYRGRPTPLVRKIEKLKQSLTQ